MRRYEFPWRVLDAVLPSTCFCCGERLRASQSMGACARCWLGLEPALEATPVAAAGPVVSVIRYGRAARRFLLRAKFGGHPELFGPMIAL